MMAGWPHPTESVQRAAPDDAGNEHSREDEERQANAASDRDQTCAPLPLQTPTVHKLFPDAAQHILSCTDRVGRFGVASLPVKL
jgi:hypothetical protein